MSSLDACFTEQEIWDNIKQLPPDRAPGPDRARFPCTILPFPYNYLGIPLSLRRLSWADEQPLVNAVASRIPTWKSELLTNAGRVLLTKVMLSAIPKHRVLLV
jgi:hypothetical protein